MAIEEEAGKKKGRKDHQTRLGGPLQHAQKDSTDLDGLTGRIVSL